MTGVAVVIPFKGRNHKTRMSSVLGEPKRRRLALLMLASVIGVVKEAGLGADCHVVSSDESVLHEVGASDVSFVREATDSGVNGAVAAALRDLRGYDRFMVLPSDLATLTAAGLREAVALSETLSVVVSPSASFTGTNLLVFRRVTAPELSYDDDSFWHHLASAASLRLSVAVYTGGGVTFDLDTPLDAKFLMGIEAGEASLFLRRELTE
jgi:2-phospho-L-lactate/phosphoenolpyruvate guanylyltransferase